MLKRQGEDATPVDLQAFAAFNRKLFHDPTALPDAHAEILAPERHHIGPDELQDVLRHHFKANRSSGWSPMPLQLLKHLGGKGINSFSKFLNKSAIEELAPVSWRETKVVPLYKGKGDPGDLNNFRSIAITPPFTKIFMAVITKRLDKLAESTGLHAPTQAGFRKYHTTTEQAMLVQ